MLRLYRCPEQASDSPLDTFATGSHASRFTEASTDTGASVPTAILRMPVTQSSALQARTPMVVRKAISHRLRNRSQSTKGAATNCQQQFPAAP